MIYVAPPDHHLVLNDGKIILDHGPRQNGFRPSIDPLFRSAARQYRERTIGILLSGLLDDGVFGMQEIKQRGGITIAQDPEEALFNSLPLAAINYGVVDYILPVRKISEIISRDGRSSDELPGETQMSDSSKPEERSIQADIDQFEEEGKHDETATTVLTCPECGGVLWEVNDGKITRYSCHVGHTYSTDTMLEEQSRAIEGALWTAIRAIKERVFLLRRLATVSKESGATRLEKRYLERADELEDSAELLRRSFLDGDLKTVIGEEPEDQDPG
jgi:two-component system chemotaxis response regulator CheB